MTDDDDLTRHDTRRYDPRVPRLTQDFYTSHQWRQGTAVPRPSRHRRRRKKDCDSLGRHPRLGCRTYCTLELLFAQVCTQPTVHGTHTCVLDTNVHIHTWLPWRTQQAPGQVPLLRMRAWAWRERVVLACTRHHIAPSHSRPSNLSCMCAQPAHRQILHSAAPWCPQAPCLHRDVRDTFFLWPAACHGHSCLHPLRRCKEFAAHQACPALACCSCT